MGFPVASLPLSAETMSTIDGVPSDFQPLQLVGAGPDRYSPIRPEGSPPALGAAGLLEAAGRAFWVGLG